MRREFFCLLAVLVVPSLVQAQDKRVLIIGIDGAGGNYLQAAATPNLDALAAAGGISYQFLNESGLVPHPPEPYGASGVNWSTILTGASATSHQVADNSFAGNNFAGYPSFFRYVKQQNPSLFTASIAHWTPINTFIVDDQDVDLKLSNLSDSGVKNVAVNLLATGDPHAVFLHFDDVDAAGHTYSWGSSQYYASLQIVDTLIGEVMTALNGRPGVVLGTEDWLILVTADHGGGLGSFSHVASQGPANWHVPLIASGPSVVDGIVFSQGTLRDVAATALWHLGIDPFGTTVEGTVVGIPFGAPNGIAGDINQDGIVAGDGTGDAATDDVTAFVEGWLSAGHTSVYQAYTHGDLNLDRVTNLRDWAIFNQLSPAMARAVMNSLMQVPEPSLATSAFISVLILSGWRGARI